MIPVLEPGFIFILICMYCVVTIALPELNFFFLVAL